MADIFNECISGYLPDVGKTNGVAAAAGMVGEVIAAEIGSTSAVSLVSGSVHELCNVTLTPGFWDVTEYVAFIPELATTITMTSGHVNTNNTGTPGARTGFFDVSQVIAGTSHFGRRVSSRYIVVTVPTVIYACVRALFSGGTLTCYGGLYAQRRGVA